MVRVHPGPRWIPRTCKVRDGPDALSVLVRGWIPSRPDKPTSPVRLWPRPFLGGAEHNRASLLPLWSSLAVLATLSRWRSRVQIPSVAPSLLGEMEITAVYGTAVSGSTPEEGARSLVR